MHFRVYKEELPMFTKRKILVIIGIVVALVVIFYTGVFGMAS
jgi:hypothetical protein